MKRAFFLSVALLGTLAVSAGQAQDSPADPFEAMAKYTFGQSREPLALIDELIRKSAPAGYKAIETKLLATLKTPATTTDAKRSICRWLAIVGSADCVPAVAEFLTDPDLAHPARMALEPLADPAAGAALRDALPKVKGKLLAGLIGSIGVRRDAQAVSALSGLAGDSDPAVAGAALAALGAIGTSEAARALDGIRPPAALGRTLARAQLTAAGHLAAAGPGPQAAGLYRRLLQADQPKAVRVAALKGLIGVLGRPEAVQLISDVVQGDDGDLRAAAISAYTGSADKALQDAVAEQLPAMKPAGQLLLLGVLADAADVAARPAVLKIIEADADVELRVAALACLARHGEAADVPLVVRLATGEPAAVAEQARKVLERMGKSGVDEALTRLIESPKPEERAVVLATLASRRVEAALPTLVRLVGGPDAALATEAARALGVLGKNEQLTALATALIRTTSDELRNVAGEAVKAICNRAVDKQAAAQALLAALAQATTPAARMAALPLLGYTRGDAALRAVRQAMQDENPDVREVAIRTLVAWPEAAAAPYLIELAKTAQKPSHAVLALRDGCLRLANQKELPLAERVSIYRSVLETAQRPEEKKQAIAGLADLPSLAALELLQTRVKDEALRSDAAAALIRLARQLGVVYNQRALAALQDLQAQAPTDELRRQAAEAITALQNAGQSPEGFIVAWMLSGPYMQEGKTGADLFDMAFAPEKPGAAAEWRPVTVPPGGRPGLVEFDKLFGGNERAAYVRTQLTATRSLEAQLLIGSDDGVKVWLNGQVVHANNAIRPCSPDQDKAKITLKPGANVLLVKVTQGGGEWSVCCRVRTLDGKELDGVTVAPNEP